MKEEEVVVGEYGTDEEQGAEAEAEARQVLQAARARKVNAALEEFNGVVEKYGISFAPLCIIAPGNIELRVQIHVDGAPTGAEIRA